MKISNADLKRSDELLTLTVTAIAPSSGWTNVTLSLAVYVKPPEDGLQDVILTATAPVGPASDVIEIFTPSERFTMPPWFQGVRISNRAANETWVLRSPVLNHFPIGSSGLTMDTVTMDGDKLLIPVRYAGGYKRHAFQLNWDGDIIKTFPPKVRLELSHNDHGDPGKAIIPETLQFDLSVLPCFPLPPVELIIEAPGASITIPYTRTSEARKSLIDSKKSGPAGRIIERGYSDQWNLAEAMKDAIGKLPDRSAGTADYLSTYIIKQTGAEKGGFPGLNRLFVDVEG